jgi:uncharacterized membrane protein
MMTKTSLTFQRLTTTSKEALLQIKMILIQMMMMISIEIPKIVEMVSRRNTKRICLRTLAAVKEGYLEPHKTAKRHS